MGRLKTWVKIFIVSAARSVILRACSVYLKLFKHASLVQPIRDIESNLQRRRDQAPRLGALLDGPLHYLDVGARGGVSQFLSRYSAFFKNYLAEADPEEAAELRRRGNVVIDKVVAERSGKIRFNVTRKGGLSSVLEPDGEFLPYYKGDSDRFDVVKRLDLDCVTIEEIARQYSVAFDLIKLDTQGSELSILRGLGPTRPLFLISEISFGELYKGQATFYELGQFLRDVGYAAWEISWHPQPVPSRFKDGGRASGIPLHGDACFMPNWNSPQGRVLIERKDLQWAALMLIFGMEDLLRYVMNVVELPNAVRIASALSRPPGLLPINPLETIRY